MALLSRTSILAPRSACFPGYHAKAAFPAVGKLSICRAVDKDLDEADNGGLHPMLEMAVPSDQRPVNELRKLKESQLSSWVSRGFSIAGHVLLVKDDIGLFWKYGVLGVHDLEVLSF